MSTHATYGDLQQRSYLDGQARMLDQHAEESGLRVLTTILLIGKHQIDLVVQDLDDHFAFSSMWRV